MSVKNDNPEWTKDDFKNAKDASTLPKEILDAFPKTRGKQKDPKKIPVSIRLSQSVVEHYKATGSGWQKRIDDILKENAGL